MIKLQQYRLFSIFFAFLICGLLLSKDVHAVCTINPSGTYMEAEDFTGGYNFNSDPPVESDEKFDVVTESGANGGKALVSGAELQRDSIPRNDVKTYEMKFPSAGKYQVWALGRGISYEHNSLFFALSDTPVKSNRGWKAWNYPENDEGFMWTKSIYTTDGLPYDNTIYIEDPDKTYYFMVAMRESNTVTDGFYFFKDGMGIDGPDWTTGPDTVTTISPINGCDGPAWTLDPGVIEPTNFKGYNAASLSFTITNTGNQNDGSSATVTSSQPSWIQFDNNTIPALNIGDSHTVTVHFYTAGLSVGTHDAEISITGNANNSPQKISVQLLVKSVPSTAACGEIPLYAENLINPAIMVLLDTSGSMDDPMDIGGGETMMRISIAEDVLKEVFLDRSIAWGFGTWTGGSGKESDPDDSPDYYTNYRIGVSEHDAAHQTALQDKADDGSPSGWTPLVPALKGGLEYFKSNRKDSHYGKVYQSIVCQPRIIVLVTDGLGNTATNNTKIDEVVKALTDEGISVVCVGFGLDDATQLDRIVQAMQTAGNKSDDDYLYHLHNEDSVSGIAVPFMAQNRSEFISAMNSIVSNVKAQVFHGSSPAPTTSVDNGAILLNASFDASDWSGNITATEFDVFTGALKSTPIWQTKDMVTKANINGFIYDFYATDKVSAYTTSSITGDNYLCKPMGDVINSTPAIVGSPPYFYKFDGYYDFKYNQYVRLREETAYFGANDGALHAVRLKDGVEKWRFYPDSVKSQMALQMSNPSDDMCSPSYCHKFLVDGSPEPADVFVNSTLGWRTILVTGLGEGGKAFFALDVTYGDDFDAAATTLSGGGTLDVQSKFLWEFTDTDDPELGLATAWPTTSRVKDGTDTKWITLFGSGPAENDILQADKEAYIFAVGSYDMGKIWDEASADGSSSSPAYKVKLTSATLKNDIPSPPRVIDTQDDDYIADRIYVGNMYGNMYRIKDIDTGDIPESELFFNSGNTDHQTPVTARPGYAYAGGGDIWLYYGTGKYNEQIDKMTIYQQYFFGLFDDDAAKSTPYTISDLYEMQTEVISAYAIDKDGNTVDLNEDSLINSEDLRQYRTVSCSTTDADGYCSPSGGPWVLKLAVPNGTGSERVISQPLIVAGVVFFTTFIPDSDVCEGNGDTWLFAVDWKTGSFVENEVFDINNDDNFDEGDKEVKETDGTKQKVAGVYVGTGKPSGELIIYNDILYVGTTNEPPKPIKVNLKGLRTRLKSWQQQFND